MFTTFAYPAYQLATMGLQDGPDTLDDFQVQLRTLNWVLTQILSEDHSDIFARYHRLIEAGHGVKNNPPIQALRRDLQFYFERLLHLGYAPLGESVLLLQLLQAVMDGAYECTPVFLKFHTGWLILSMQHLVRIHWSEQVRHQRNLQTDKPTIVQMMKVKAIEEIAHISNDAVLAAKTETSAAQSKATEAICSASSLHFLHNHKHQLAVTTHNQFTPFLDAVNTNIINNDNDFPCMKPIYKKLCRVQAVLAPDGRALFVPDSEATAYRFEEQHHVIRAFEL
eukprot:jgi/Psemu1/44837/gm1.44837_g